MIDAGALPPVVAALVALFALLGAAFALIGSFGLLRLRTFYQRVHPPTQRMGADTLAVAPAEVAGEQADGPGGGVEADRPRVARPKTPPPATVPGRRGVARRNWSVKRCGGQEKKTRCAPSIPRMPGWFGRIRWW